MTIQNIAIIVIPILGGVISILLGLISFFAVRSYNSIDGNMTKHSDSIGQLALSIKDLAGIIKSLEMQFVATHADTERALKELREEIELCRTRTHQQASHITALRLQGELKNGWKFSKEWETPGLGQVLKKDQQ